MLSPLLTSNATTATILGCKIERGCDAVLLFFFFAFLCVLFTLTREVPLLLLLLAVWCDTTLDCEPK